MNNVKGKLPNRRQIIGFAAAAMSLPALTQTSSFPRKQTRRRGQYWFIGHCQVSA
jgi:hypothetical protein